MDQAFERCIADLEGRLGSIAHVSRVGDAPEVIVTTAGVIDEHRAAILRRAAVELENALGAPVAVAYAMSNSPDESAIAVFDRADQALTGVRDRLARRDANLAWESR